MDHNKLVELNYQLIELFQNYLNTHEILEEEDILVSNSLSNKKTIIIQRPHPSTQSLQTICSVLVEPTKKNYSVCLLSYNSGNPTNDPFELGKISTLGKIAEFLNTPLYYDTFIRDVHEILSQI